MVKNMPYNLIDFKDLPSKETPVCSENLNHIQQGIVLAVSMSEALDGAWKRGELKGKDGDPGKDGVDGKNFEIDGSAELLADLPPPSEALKGQLWVTYQYGHLHYCDGTQWQDWGQFVGIKGDKGDDGVFDPDSLTDEQIATLWGKLYAYNKNHTWGYKTTLTTTGQSVRFQVADLNLDLQINKTGTNSISYFFYPHNTSQPATYYVKRLSNYDMTSWEASVTSGYKPQAITTNGFQLDNFGYLPGNEYTQIQVIDPTNDFWYSFWFTGTGDGVMYIDVMKRQVQGRQVISPAQ